MDRSIEKIVIRSFHSQWPNMFIAGEELGQIVEISDTGRFEMIEQRMAYTKSGYSQKKIIKETLSQNSVHNLFQLILNYLEGSADQRTFDLGTWDVRITYDNGAKDVYQGSFNYFEGSSETKYSRRIRELVGNYNLLLFEGRIVDYIETFKIKYCEKMNRPLYYKEELTISRTEGCLYLNRVESDNVIELKFRNHEKVGQLLDLISDYHFEEALTSKSDIPSETIQIDIDYQIQVSKRINGTFDIEGLPPNWFSVMEKIKRTIDDNYQFNLFASRRNIRTRRLGNQNLFCVVQFTPNGKTYHYLVVDLTINDGDYVMVPVGNSTREIAARVLSVDIYTAEEEKRFPMKDMKEIVRHCDEEEIVVIAKKFGESIIAG